MNEEEPLRQAVRGRVRVRRRRARAASSAASDQRNVHSVETIAYPKLYVHVNSFLVCWLTKSTFLAFREIMIDTFFTFYDIGILNGGYISNYIPTLSILFCSIKSFKTDRGMQFKSKIKTDSFDPFFFGATLKECRDKELFLRRRIRVDKKAWKPK